MAELRKIDSTKASDPNKDAMQAGAESVRKMGEEFGRMFGLGDQNDDLTRQARQNLAAVRETSAVLLRGFQEISREWFQLCQQRLHKNAEAMMQLSQCRSVQDIAAVQTEAMRDNLEQFAEGTRRLGEHSVQVAAEAAGKVTAHTKQAGARLRPVA
jgi:hypothetical protein